MNQRLKGQGGTRNEPAPEAGIPESGSFSRLKSEDMRKEIEKMSKKLEEDQIIKEIKENEKESSALDQSVSESEKGMPDSDSEDDKRL